MSVAKPQFPHCACGSTLPRSDEQSSGIKENQNVVALDVDVDATVNVAIYVIIASRDNGINPI